jgi:hypothetical protein
LRCKCCDLIHYFEVSPHRGRNVFVWVKGARGFLCFKFRSAMNENSPTSIM